MAEQTVTSLAAVTTGNPVSRRRQRETSSVSHAPQFSANSGQIPAPSIDNCVTRPVVRHMQAGATQHGISMVHEPDSPGSRDEFFQIARLASRRRGREGGAERRAELLALPETTMARPTDPAPNPAVMTGCSAAGRRTPLPPHNGPESQISAP